MKNMIGRGYHRGQGKIVSVQVRPLKLSLRDGLLMLFVYYRLYITSTLTHQLPIRPGPEQRAH